MDVTAISNKQKLQTENKTPVVQSAKVNEEGASFKDTIVKTQKQEMPAEKNIIGVSDKNVTNPIENKLNDKELSRVSNINQNPVQNGEINNVTNKELNRVSNRNQNPVQNEELNRIPNKEVKALEQEINLIADINNSKKVKKTVDETPRFDNGTLLENETINKSKNKLGKNVLDLNSDKNNNEKLVKNTTNTEKEAIKLSMSEQKLLKDEKILKENKIPSEVNLNKKTTNVRKEAKSKITGRIKPKETDVSVIAETVQSNKQLELKPLKKQEQNIVEKINIKNIIDTDAVLTSFAETDRALGSSKTNDILNFIDTNLSTSNTKKTTKGSATGAASKVSSKKSNDSINMTENDIKFFTSLAEKSAVSVDSNNSAQNQLTLKDVEDSQQLEVSKALLNALKESRENNKSFRVDFDKDISVVLKVSREGKISAEFIPGDKIVEQYLKQNLPILKQKFEEDGLEYDNLSYREDRKKEHQEERRNNRRNNKENGYE